jgi:hypothetical protein
LLRVYLEAHGVLAPLFDEHLVHLFWYYSDAIGGVRLMVPEGQLEEARALAREYGRDISVDRAPPAWPRLWPLVLLLSWGVGVPMIIFGRREPKGTA